MKPESHSGPSASQVRPKAYSYIRMSTREQLQGGSLKRQVELTREYCKERGLDLIEKYDDIGVSAFRGLNSEYGALRRFRTAAADGEIPSGSYFIIESIDRLSRQTAHVAVGILSEIISYDITVVTLDNKLEFSKESIENSPYQLFVLIGEMTRAHEESRRKSGMLSHVWKTKRAKLFDNLSPMTSRLPAWLQLSKDGSHIEIIKERGKVVAEIFDLACAGYGTYSTAKLLNERGEKPWGTPKRDRKTGKRGEPLWRESYIKKILTNRAVLGEFQPHRLELTPGKKHVRVPVGECVKGYYPQLIDEAIFRAAALATERRRLPGRGRKGNGYSNIFSGLLRCTCGAGMRYLDKGPMPKGGKYLRCSIALSGGSCVKTAYRYERIEAFILSTLESLDVQKILGGESAAKAIAETRTQQELVRLEIESTEKKITVLNNILEQDGGSPPASTLIRLRELERGLSELRSRLVELDNQVAEFLAIDPARREAILADLLGRISDPDVTRRMKARRALASELQRMIEVIIIRPDVEFAHEIIDIDPSWQRRYRAESQTRLERHLKENGFELSIRYRSGEQQIVRGIDKAKLKLKWNDRFSDIRMFSKHQH